MSKPKVSVVIPAYNQSAFIAQAIQSVVDQTYSNWELLIVDDESTDGTEAVVARFTDPRIRYIRQANRGVSGARNTGFKNGTGEYIAFLDADDYFLPEKLEAHVAHLEQDREIDLSYGSAIEVQGDGTPTWLRQAPKSVSLVDLVLDFPFTINDFMIRRVWVQKVGGFLDDFRLHSEDRDFYLRLALEGCRFGYVRQFVAYRRVHPGRIFQQIPERIETMHRVLESAFRDPRCPADVLAVRDIAYGKIYFSWACQEYFQNEIESAEEHLRRAVQLMPSLFEDDAQAFHNALVWTSVRDGGDPEERLGSVYNQLSPEFGVFPGRLEWGIGQVYFIKGIHAVMWKHAEAGKACFAKAQEFQDQLDPFVFPILGDQLANYEDLYGRDKAQEVVQNLLPYLKKYGSPRLVQRFVSLNAVNLAFSAYRQGNYSRVPAAVMQAIFSDPSHLTNPGIRSIFFRSILKFMLSGSLRVQTP